MLAAALTSCFFALSALSGSRAAALVGPVNANFIRLSLAAFLLSVYAFTFGQGFHGPGLSVFLISGLVGFGLGDIALFQAYERIGSRRTILLVQCLAVPFAALTEWFWLGTQISLQQIMWITLILAGVSLVMIRRQESIVANSVLWPGIGFGVLAALGQGWGAVLSRKAISLNQAAGFELDGWTAAFQRIMAGLVVAAFFYVWFRCKRRSLQQSRLAHLPPEARLRALLFCFANGLAGPVLGVGCYQWALTTAPSGIVLAIVATTPIVVLPLAWLLEGDKPTWLSVSGSLLAISAVVGLLFAS